MIQDSSFNLNQNTIFMVVHGKHVVVYLENRKGATKAIIEQFFIRLIDLLDREKINILQFYSRPGWVDCWKDQQSQAAVHLLVASCLQEAIGHLRREKHPEARELLPQQRQLLDEILEELLTSYQESVNVRMVELWKKLNTLRLPAPEYAPPPGLLDHVETLSTDNPA